MIKQDFLCVHFVCTKGLFLFGEAFSEETLLVRIRNYKIVCILLIVFVIVSGMCFEGIKTDSTFACAPIKEPNVYSISFDIVFRDGVFF